MKYESSPLCLAAMVPGTLHPAPARLCVGGAGLTARLLNPLSWGLFHCDVGPTPSHTQRGSLGGWSHFPAPYSLIFGCPRCSYFRAQTVSVPRKLVRGSGLRGQEQERSHAAVTPPFPAPAPPSVRTLLPTVPPLHSHIARPVSEHFTSSHTSIFPKPRKV